MWRGGGPWTCPPASTHFHVIFTGVRYLHLSVYLQQVSHSEAHQRPLIFHPAWAICLETSLHFQVVLKSGWGGGGWGGYIHSAGGLFPYLFKHAPVNYSSRSCTGSRKHLTHAFTSPQCKCTFERRVDKRGHIRGGGGVLPRGRNAAKQMQHLPANLSSESGVVIVSELYMKVEA